MGHNETVEFSVRAGMFGTWILRVIDYSEIVPEWGDASPKHLPEFFRQLRAEEKAKP